MDNINFYLTSELNKILICLQLYGNQSICKKCFILYRRNMIYYITVSIFFNTIFYTSEQQRQKFLKNEKRALAICLP